jgi:hypothetical protein
MSDEQAFAALSRRACPPVGEALFAVAAAWHPVDWSRLDAQLDELAVALFGVEPSGRARAGALAALLVSGFEPEPRAVAGLWLDEVLDTGRGHPLLLAAIGTELGRRAGWQIAVCSSPAGWYAGLQQEGVIWLVDPTGETSGGGAPDKVRRHCAHEVAFVVLTGLAERFTGTSDEAQARRLRDRLDVFSS